MKSVVFREPNRYSIDDSPMPAVGKGDALVKVHACGICGTDIHILHGEHIVEFPVIPGHEFSGEVVEIGKEVTGLTVGDRVTVDPNIVDRTCYFCRRGEINLCRNLTAVGVNSNGGFAEFCSVPAEQLYRVPESVSLDEAAMVEPLACCIHGIDRAGIVPGSTVAVLGAGTVGLMLLQLAKAAGAGCVIVSEPDSNKRELAGKLGGDILLNPAEVDIIQQIMEITEVGADVVIEAAGRQETAAAALKIARRGGTVLQFGVVSPERTVNISPYDIFYGELTIVGSFVNPFTHARALSMLASRQIDVTSLVTHRFGIEEISKALETAQGASAIKILVFPH